MIDEFDQNVHFVEIDIEEDQEIAEAAGIMGTPCVQFFKNKEMLRLALLLTLINLIFFLIFISFFISLFFSLQFFLYFVDKISAKYHSKQP